MNKDLVDCIHTLQGHEGWITSIKTGNLENVFTSSTDGTICEWDLRSATLTQTLKGHQGPVHSISISSDGSTLVSGGEDKTVRVWDLRDPTKNQVLTGHTGIVWCVAIQDKVIYSGGGDYLVRVWKDGKVLQTIEAHSKLVWCLSVFESFFVTGSDDTTAKVWDKIKFKCLRVLKGHTDLVTSISQKDNNVYTSSLDKTLRVWNEKGECLRTIDTSEVGWVWDIVITGDRVYFGGYHGIKLFNLATGKWVPLTFEGHTKQVSCLAIKGETLHTGSWDKTVRTWKEKGRSWRTNTNLKDIEKFYASGRTGSFAQQRSPGSVSMPNIAKIAVPSNKRGSTGVITQNS